MKPPPFYELSLFVAGASPNSVRAITNLKNMCEKYFSGHYKLEIIDIHQQSLPSGYDQVKVLPMLIKNLPLPSSRLIGDMSDTFKVLKSLDYE